MILKGKYGVVKSKLLMNLNIPGILPKTGKNSST